jgi:hypothetical protein
MHFARTVLWAGALLLWLCGTAFAEAKVVVELKDASGKPADGEVSLYTKAGERVAGCTTAAGQCEMSNVAGGNYEVRVVPKAGAAPKPRSAMIPPEGTAKLIVSTGS